MCRSDSGASPFRIYEKEQLLMNNIVYIVGAVVIVLVILSFLGLR